MNRKVKAATLSVASNSLLTVSKLGVGLATGSVSIISEAAHSALDLFAAIIAFTSVRVSGMPADKEHPFGHGKFENLSGMIEAVLIFIAAAWIIFHSIRKLLHPEPVNTVFLGMVVMGLSALANILISRHLFKVAKETDSIALEADAQHLRTDVWTSFGVFGGLAVIQVTNMMNLHYGARLDPIVALMVAAMIIRVSLGLTNKAAAPLLDAGLPDSELRELADIVMKTPKVVGFHKLRARKSGPYRDIDYHLIVPAGMAVLEAHNIAENIEDKIRLRFPKTHVVTHIEPDTADVTTEPDTEIKHRTTPRRTRLGPKSRHKPPQSI